MCSYVAPDVIGRGHQAIADRTREITKSCAALRASGAVAAGIVVPYLWGETSGVVPDVPEQIHSYRLVRTRIVGELVGMSWNRVD
jgi:hypothetical protein